MNSALLSAVAETNKDHLSSIEAQNTAYLRQSDGGEVVGQERLSRAQKRALIDQAARKVEDTFLAYHEHGGFAEGAAYGKARNEWAELLMEWGRV